MTDELKKDDAYFIPHPSSVILKLRRVLRGEIKVNRVAREAIRRGRVALQHRHERARLDQLDKRPARLGRDFSRLSPAELLNHFRTRTTPQFLPGFNTPADQMAKLQKTHFPLETSQLIESAGRIARDHRWQLLGYDEQSYGDPIEWRRDIVSGQIWPLDYHLDVNLANEGADVRVLWELNRLGHFLTLGRAYVVTRDEQLAEAFFQQLESWRNQNPVGSGPNWACAMEVALRAMNLLAAFQMFRSSESLTEQRLVQLLAMLDAHGAHIHRNSEFSYIATSNHYLSDVVGLFWLGIMLPELEAAKRWRVVGKRELLREMEVQVLGDGADFESSTGYHRFVLELFLYSFVLCHAVQSEIPDRYWRKLYAMLAYVRGYLRPDESAPLIGDTDSGQVLPIVRRVANDHAYVLTLGAAFMNDASLLSGLQIPLTEEVLWVLGDEGVRNFQVLRGNAKAGLSMAFPDAGTYVMREGDLYLLFNASGSGINGRGSHGHNDVLSIDVSACGTNFIVDPGTYVYRTDLEQRNLFRSTAYHSTVAIDGKEQNAIDKDLPFMIGDTAHPHDVTWKSTSDRDLAIAEHDGYANLGHPIKHRRKVEFDKRSRFWVIDDELLGTGEHVFNFRFHLAHDVNPNVGPDGTVSITSRDLHSRLLIIPLDLTESPELVPCWTSSDYGAKMASVSVCWTLTAQAPLKKRWALVPVCQHENETERIRVIKLTLHRIFR